MQVRGYYMDMALPHATTHYSLRTSHCLLLTTRHSLLTTPHSPLPTPHSPLPTPHSPLPTPHSLSPLQLFHELVYDNLNVDVMHAERTQQQRDHVVEKFRTGKVWVLVCTELMARSTAARVGPGPSAHPCGRHACRAAARVARLRWRACCSPVGRAPVLVAYGGRQSGVGCGDSLACRPFARHAASTSRASTPSSTTTSPRRPSLTSTALAAPAARDARGAPSHSLPRRTPSSCAPSPTS